MPLATLSASPLLGRRRARFARRWFGLRSRGNRPKGERGVQGNGHGGFTAQELTPAQLDFRSSLALPGHPDPFGVESHGVVDAVDADLPLE